MRYNVYGIYPNYYYQGLSLVAATSIDEANVMIENFKNSDPENHAESYGYSKVDETDIIKDIYSDREGIIFYGINYCG